MGGEVAHQLYSYQQLSIIETGRQPSIQMVIRCLLQEGILARRNAQAKALITYSQARVGERHKGVGVVSPCMPSCIRERKKEKHRAAGCKY